MTTMITVCDTCKCEGWDAETDPQTDGEKFAEMIENAAQNASGVTVRRHSCLMGCKRACNVAIQAENKLQYVLGSFAPDQESADGLVEYAQLHSQSETGQVPFKTWPTPIKGHFVTRLPILPAK